MQGCNQKPGKIYAKIKSAKQREKQKQLELRRIIDIHDGVDR